MRSSAAGGLANVPSSPALPVGTIAIMTPPLDTGDLVPAVIDEPHGLASAVRAAASHVAARLADPAWWVPNVVAVGLLVFLIVPFGRELQARGVTVDRLPLNGALLAFVVIYLWALLAEGRRPAGFRALGGPIVLVVLGFAISVLDDGNWSVLFVAVAAVGGRLVPSGRAVAVILVAAASVVLAAPGAETALAASRMLERTLESVFEVVLVGLGMLGFSQLERTARERDLARYEVARLAAEGERVRIARDLHDILGHSLSMVALKTELARRLLNRDPARAAIELGEVEALVRSSLRDVRETVAGYRRIDLDTELAGARMALGAAGIDVRIERDANVLDSATDTLLGWIVREGTTNVVRHSGATRCSIRIEGTLTQLRLEITDDGSGGAGPAPGSIGHGLIGVHERVEAAGGQVQAGGRVGGGYRLAVTLPIRTGGLASEVGGRE